MGTNNWDPLERNLKHFIGRPRNRGSLDRATHGTTSERLATIIRWKTPDRDGIEKPHERNPLESNTT
eukprot:3072215-Pyramimonas_sp.AAC.1